MPNDKQYSIDHDKSTGGERIRLTESGCSVPDLLRMAEKGEVLIFAALRPFTAVSSNTQGERHRYFPWHKSSADRVELLPKYAGEIEMFGSVEITCYPADTLPKMGDDSLWFWCLDKPQTIGVENLYISEGHVTAITAPSGATEEKQAISGVDRSDSRKRPPLQQAFQQSEILRVIGELGYDALKLPKDVSGKPGVKAEVRGNLSHHKWTGSVFNKAWERLSANNEIIKMK